jgi:hypothetical protein
LETQLTSGAKLTVAMAPFEDAIALYDAILKTIRGSQVSPEVLDTDIGNPMEMLRGNAALFTLAIDKGIALVTSQEVRQALFRCFLKATYNNRAIDKDLFDDPKIAEQAREDMAEMSKHVAILNCKPFWKGTFSGLLAQSLTNNVTPKPS